MTHDEARGGLRPIETAPRDGSWFAIVNAGSPQDRPEVGRYDPMTWRSYVDAGDGLFKAVDTVIAEFTHDNFGRATHWMPLPPAPETAEAGRHG